ncbi:MPP7 [Cordylochernes scorpioides]|uniref:MPP7 n=1 Tax=Cordylochernes scorpioides TaxID=51811 RepID=A0ABY6L284_9ARAC|nr:MPP7 [Cordylochernes scorpioides]
MLFGNVIGKYLRLFLLGYVKCLFLQALIEAHDQVARKEFLPTLPSVPSLANHDAIKIVQLIKNKEPLGATVKFDENTSSLIVAHVQQGGAAERSGEYICQIGNSALRSRARDDMGSMRPLRPLYFAEV